MRNMLYLKICVSMDRSYILFNSIVYGWLALVFSAFYAYAKIQHLSIGSFMVFLWYIIYQYMTTWFTFHTTAILLWFIACYMGSLWVLIHWFPNEKSRDLLSIVFTLWLSLVTENVLHLFYGPWSVSVSGIDVPLYVLIVLFIGLNIFLFYMSWATVFGKMMKGVFERSLVVSSLWIRVQRLQYITFFLLLLILTLIAGLVLVESNIKPGDWLFYLIKGIWISILVGFSQKQWVFVGALLYVLVEYFFFIHLWRPIIYKESLILVIILLVLVWKPSGLFSFWKRHL